MIRTLGGLLILVFLTSGCGLLKDKAYTLTQAEEKLVEFCAREGETPIVTRRLGRTQWIYLPMKDPLFDFKLSPGQGHTKKKITPLMLLSLEGSYTEGTFSFDYDTITDVIPPDPTDYGSAYTETYIKKRQLVYQALQETFFNLDDNQETRDSAPLFFIIVIADTTKGLATRSTVYFSDIRGYLTAAIPPDEYYLRERIEIIGDEEMIGNLTGQGLKFEDVAWPEFLAEQIKFRARFKFTQSDFPPESDPGQTIAGIAVNTLRFYPFKEYDRIVTSDIRAKTSKTYTKEDFVLLEEKPLWERKSSRMHVIRFSPKAMGIDTSLTADEKDSSEDPSGLSWE